MTMKIGLLIAFIFLSAVSADIVIECKYTTEEKVNLEGTYDACEASISSSLSVPNGTPIKIIPIDEIQRHKIAGFGLEDQDISDHFDNVLKAIASSFPNLNNLALRNISISHVSKDHLKLFPELEFLNLSNNKIKVLESDLFMYTPKIKFIEFTSNMISNVDDKLLNSVDYIIADFSSNPCIEQSTCKKYVNEEKMKREYSAFYKLFTAFGFL